MKRNVKARKQQHRWDAWTLQEDLILYDTVTEAQKEGNPRAWAWKEAASKTTRTSEAASQHWLDLKKKIASGTFDPEAARTQQNITVVRVEGNTKREMAQALPDVQVPEINYLELPYNQVVERAKRGDIAVGKLTEFNQALQSLSAIIQEIIL